ncbi:MAG: restriction endonuclease subunit S, partial [Haliea sp.]
NTEKNLANARELFESYLNSVFSLSNVEWQERQLNELVRGDCSLSYGIVQPGNDVEDGLPVVRPTDLTDKVIALSGLKKIDPSLAHAYSRTTLHGNDLLLCVRGSTGTVSIAHEELKGANVTRGIVPIRFDDCLISDGFGYYLMCSPKVQRQIADMTYGAALMQINIRDLRKIVVQVPPLNIQSRIKSQLDDVSHESVRLRSIYQQKLTTLTELKQSLLQKAFTGELTAEKEKDEVKEAVA